MYVFQKHKVEIINQYAYFKGPLKPQSGDRRRSRKQVLSISVEKVEEKYIDLWEVTYIAENRIFYPDKELVKKFNTVTTVKKVDGQWHAHELISTGEL